MQQRAQPQSTPLTAIADRYDTNDDDKRPAAAIISVRYSLIKVWSPDLIQLPMTPSPDSNGSSQNRRDLNDLIVADMKKILQKLGLTKKEIETVENGAGALIDANDRIAQLETELGTLRRREIEFESAAADARREANEKDARRTALWEEFNTQYEQYRTERDLLKRDRDLLKDRLDEKERSHIQEMDHLNTQHDAAVQRIQRDASNTKDLLAESEARMRRAEGRATELEKIAGVKQLRETEFEQKIIQLAHRIHELFKRLFSNTSQQALDPDKVRRFYRQQCPSWYPQLCSQSEVSNALRVVAAQNIVGAIISRSIFRSFHVTQDTEPNEDEDARDQLLSNILFKDNPEKEAIFRSVYWQVIELAGDKTTLVTKAIQSAVKKLGTLLGSMSEEAERNSLTQELKPIMTEALNIWGQFVLCSNTRVITSMEDEDSEWDEMEEDGNPPYGLSLEDIQAHVPESPTSSYFPLFPVIYCPDENNTWSGDRWNLDEQSRDQSEGRPVYFWGYALKEGSSLVLAAQREIQRSEQDANSPRRRRTFSNQASMPGSPRLPRSPTFPRGSMTQSPSP